jgi:phosphoglycolate phosphatase-like HAD superfamily hydrolase
VADPLDDRLPPPGEGAEPMSEERDEEIPVNWCWHTRPVAPGPAVIFDLDGVLSDAASRQHFLEWGRRDWDAFFDACGDDPLVDEVARLLELLDSSLYVVLLTGRPLRVQPQTLSWLAHNRLRWDLLVMRNRGDYAQVARFKRAALHQLRAYGIDPRLAFEDDPRNRDMFHSEGIPCIYIHSGYYD